MDKHIIDLYNQALKDYDEAIQKLERIKDLIGGNNVYLEDDCGINNITRKLLQIIDEVEQ